MHGVYAVRANNAEGERVRLVVDAEKRQFKKHAKGDKKGKRHDKKMKAKKAEQ